MLLSVIILTYNEAVNLPTTLASLERLSAEVFIVDSGSTDGTVAIAQSFGCKVVTNPFENQAQQLNWALANLPIVTPWIIRLDADERMMPELVDELHRVLPHAPSDITGFQMKRRVFFMGRWMRHGGYYPTWLLRIWRTGGATCEQRWMDEHMVLLRGRSGKLVHDIIDENRKGLSFWIDKHNHYADRELLDVVNADLSRTDDLINACGQAQNRRWMKKNLYGRVPLFVRPFVYFLLRYTIGLGFLDGLEGFVFHILQGFWYRFLIDAKIYEARKRDRQAAIVPKPRKQPVYR
jgi:glycosyltransferase involved in cell wall biosynthesis